MKITFGMIKKIHALKTALKMGEDEYREMVMNVHGFSGTSKDLSSEEAGALIERLEARAIAAGVWQRFEGKKEKYANLGKRGTAFATPKQCRKIEAMFREVSYYKNDTKAFEHAFRNFLGRMARVDDIRFLEKRDVSKIIRALEAMKGQRRGS